ncbi:hypothetical protein B0T20DRAFT_452359 [Sordaria brevicollis]|uniref:Uncharacterized protein n=1 Tax=Sordaria brevicollis TaxID=83679 RepID=A0AAE0PHV1_SORBR|nr:hypothetical protein B0T20DRAFT_452359 [Sordaria brevicollis]
MVLLPRKKTPTEAGWIVFAVLFSTFTSAIFIFACWWTTRGGSGKKSSTQQQQQSGEISSRTRSRRSVRYWYYYPEYFGHNGSSESPPSEDYTSYAGTEYHLEQQQTPNYYIYPPPPYPPCPDPPPPPPRPPRTPPHIAVYRTRPVNVMRFLDRTQKPRKPPPPVAEVTSPEPEGTASSSGDGSSSSSSGSPPDEPPPEGTPPDGPKGDDPSGGPRPDGSAPGSPTPIIVDVHPPDPTIIDVHSPKSEESEISKQDVSEAQANFSKLMSEADTTSERSAPSQAGSEQSTSVNLSHRSRSKASEASIQESDADDLPTREPSARPSSHIQRSAAGSKERSPRSNSERPASGVRYVKAPTTKGSLSSKGRHSSRAVSSHGHAAASPSKPSSVTRSTTPPPLRHTSNRHSRTSNRSRHSRLSPMPRLSPSPPRSHISHHSLPASRRSRQFSPPQSPTPPHHSPIPQSPSRHTHSRFDDHRPPSRQSSRSAASMAFSPPQSPTPPHDSPIPYSPSRRYSHSSNNRPDARPASRHSVVLRPRSRVSSMPPSPTVTDFASSLSGLSSYHRDRSGPGSPRSVRSSEVSPAYKSGGFRTAASLSPQPEEHEERNESRQSSRYSTRHSRDKSPSAVSVSVVELLSLEKDLDLKQHAQHAKSQVSLLGHERRGSETTTHHDEDEHRGQRSVSRNSQHRPSDVAEEDTIIVEVEETSSEEDNHDDGPAQPQQQDQHELPEDYYRSYSHPHSPSIGHTPAATTVPLPPSSMLSEGGHSSNLSPRSKSRSPYYPGKYIPVSVQVQSPTAKENRPHQASVCSVSDRSTDSGVGGVGEGKGGG